MCQFFCLQEVFILKKYCTLHKIKKLLRAMNIKHGMDVQQFSVNYEISFCILIDSIPELKLSRETSSEAIALAMLKWRELQIPQRNPVALKRSK